MTPEQEKADRERLECETGEDLRKSLHHLLIDIHQESIRADRAHAPTTRTFARFASLLCVLSNKAADREENAAKQAEANLTVQKDMLRITRWVLYLSVGLAAVTVLQLILSLLKS